MRDALVPRVEPEKAKGQRFSAYALRFAFGCGIALLSGLVGMYFGPKVGGVLLGFPAVLPASLTLIQKREGKDEASIDSIGAVLGATAMIVFAVLVLLTVQRFGVVPSIGVALIVWLAVAVGLYLLVALVFKREPHPR
ncbi:MAG TPA: DUF3147 family protein [Candidatus Dormibacteraeota bacterium]|nr:DUF3147 family protein [Candidatus Dormibacteraeota bacterium]